MCRVVHIIYREKNEYLTYAYRYLAARRIERNDRDDDDKEKRKEKETEEEKTIRKARTNREYEALIEWEKRM